MIELRLDSNFEARHKLENDPPRQNLHAHRYEISVHIQSQSIFSSPDDKLTNKALDPEVLEGLIEQFITDHLDKAILNDVMGTKWPTNELLCFWIFDRLRMPIVELASSLGHTVRVRKITVKKTCTPESSVTDG